MLCIADDNWKSYSCPLGTRFSAIEGCCISDPDNDYECLSNSGDTQMTELVSDRITVNFDCPHVGVFRNEYSVTCADYILCVNALQSRIYAIYLHCDQNQYYSQEHSACIERGMNYCDNDGRLYLVTPPTTPMPVTAAVPSALEQTTISAAALISSTRHTIIESTTIAPGMVQVTHGETSTQSTTVAPTLVITSSTEILRETTTTQPSTTHQSNAVTQSSTTTTKKDCEDDFDSDEVEIITSPSQTSQPQPISSYFFQCPESGRFVSPFGNKTELSYYILCLTGYYTDELKGYLFQCPETTVFDAEAKRCIHKSFSNIVDNVMASTEAVTESITGSTLRTTKEMVTEMFTLPTTTTTQRTQAPTTTEVLITSTLLEATTTALLTTEPTTTTLPVTTTVLSEQLNDFQCSASGRFHTQYTLNCRSYLLCLRNAYGNYSGTYFRCPKDTKFSDVLGRCVKDHDCPYYHCTNPGRYPYIKDKDRYVLCVANGDRIVAYRMKCPKKTFFSNIQRRCISDSLKDTMAW